MRLIQPPVFEARHLATKLLQIRASEQLGLPAYGGRLGISGVPSAGAASGPSKAAASNVLRALTWRFRSVGLLREDTSTGLMARKTYCRTADAYDRNYAVHAVIFVHILAVSGGCVQEGREPTLLRGRTCLVHQHGDAKTAQAKWG